MEFLRILILFVIWFFVSVGLLGLLYMISSTAREMVNEFEHWALKRRVKKKFLKVHHQHPYVIQTSSLLTKEEEDALMKMLGYHNVRTVHKTIYDQVAAEHDADPRNILRLQKAKDAADSEFFDKIEEYHNGIDGTS
jgi:hypothetical protein